MFKFIISRQHQKVERTVLVGNKKAAKPVTTVQDCVSPLVNMKPLDVFTGILGQFVTIFRGDKKQIFWRGSP